MTPEAKTLRGGITVPPLSPDATAHAALALVTALIGALRDRGVVTRDEIDEILADAASRSGYGGASRLIALARVELDRTDEE